MIERFIQALQLPATCPALDKPVFKKHFYDHGEMTARDKKIFKTAIERIQLRYNLSARSLNLQPYSDATRRYLEIPVITVQIDLRKHAGRIAEVIHRTLPHPLILIIGTTDGCAQLNLAHQRIHGADPRKITLEDQQVTPWLSEDSLDAQAESFLQSIVVRSLRLSNAYDFYSDLFQRVVALNCAAITGNYRLPAADADTTAEESAEALTEYQAIDRELASRRTALQSEVHFNRKTALKIEIEALKAELRQIAEKL